MLFPLWAIKYSQQCPFWVCVLRLGTIANVDTSQKPRIPIFCSITDARFLPSYPRCCAIFAIFPSHTLISCLFGAHSQVQLPEPTIYDRFGRPVPSSRAPPESAPPVNQSFNNYQQPAPSSTGALMDFSSYRLPTPFDSNYQLPSAYMRSAAQHYDAQAGYDGMGPEDQSTSNFKVRSRSQP